MYKVKKKFITRIKNNSTYISIEGRLFLFVGLFKL